MKNLNFAFIIIIFTFTQCQEKLEEADAYGNFEATEIIVASQSNGQINNFNIREGQVIEEKSVVGFVDTIPLFLEKEQLQIQKDIIRAESASVLSKIGVITEQLNSLKTEKQRIEELRKDNAATEKQEDDLSGLIKIRQEEIKTIERQNYSVISQLRKIDNQIHQINEKISRNLVVNPVNGTVLIKYTEDQEIVNFGKPLYKVADLNLMKLRVYISETQLADIRIGQTVDVIIDQGEGHKQYSGKVDWISSIAEFTPKTIQTREERVNLVYAMTVHVKNDGSIKIGMPGEIII